MATDRKWGVVTIGGDVVRVDVYEEALGDEWRGCVLLDAAQARRMATDLAMAAATAEDLATVKRQKA